MLDWFIYFVAGGFILACGAMSIALIAMVLADYNPGRPYDWEKDGI